MIMQALSDMVEIIVDEFSEGVGYLVEVGEAIYVKPTYTNDIVFNSNTEAYIIGAAFDRDEFIDVVNMHLSKNKQS